MKGSDTGSAAPNLQDLVADKQQLGKMHSLQVARCIKIIPVNEELAAATRSVNLAGVEQGQKGADKYVINIKQIAKPVVGLGKHVAPTDIEEGMRLG